MDAGTETQHCRMAYVMGIDGSGKTTVAEHLAHLYENHGYEVDVIWLRFNHVITKPLLGLCRVLGLTRYEMIDGIRVGYHEFHRSKLVSWAFVYLQYLDALRVSWFAVKPRQRNRKQAVILDRFVYDILIDLMIDTRIRQLDTTWIGRKLIALLPEEAITIPVFRDREQLLEARPESRVDKNFDERLQLYEELVARQGLAPLINDSTLETLLSDASKRTGFDT
jgi:hypothetical protein